MQPSSSLPTLSVTVTNKRLIAQDIYEFELRANGTESLPSFTAGAHVGVHTPCGRINKYSLCQSPDERDRYVIAVKRCAEGQGGSISLCDEINTGALLTITAPQNVFELSSIRPHYILIAGGIGITPIYAMLQQLQQTPDISFELYYLTRDRKNTAYLEEITKQFNSAQVHIHHSSEHDNNHYDLWPILENPAQKQLYCCGPMSLMEEVKAMTGHWPKNTVHFESFGVSTDQIKNNVPFEVELAHNGLKFVVDPQSSLLETLYAHHIRVPSSCESGTCGSCKTRVLAGEVEHRDMVLDETEKNDYMMVCVSRGCGNSTLLLDL